MKRIWFYDLETLNIFTATFVDRDSDKIVSFVIGDKRDDRKELFEFLNTKVAGLIGYNCIHFDQQILEYLYRYPNCTAKQIRNYASIITSDNNRKPDVPEWQFKIPNLDLFKALSLSVKAKRTGLKWCEYQIDFENIEDLPSDGDGDNWKEQVLAYNLNDVLATKALYQKYQYEIELRKTLTAREGLNLMNSTEPDMAKRLFAKYLSKAMNIGERDLRSMGTDRDAVNVEDIIFPYIKFETSKFQDVLNRFKSLSLSKTDKFEFILNHQGIDITYALGGIHAAPKNKRFDSDENMLIKSMDYVSYYPHLMFQNGLCPQHLPKDIFLPLYKGFYEERRNIPKKDPRNYILKILLNSTYGLTNDEYSFLRDRLVTLAICINGQLLLSMLIEKLTSQIPNCQLIMMNTDGCEVIIPRQYEDKYYEICKWIEDLSNIPIEYENYKSLIISDVNNYIGIFENGKTKCKGKYEFENIPLHKNKSHSIIPKAVYEYFVNGVGVETTIRNHKNIFDFCAGVRARSTDIKGKSWYELHSINNSIKKYSYEEKRNFLVQQGYIEIAKDFWRHPDWQGNMTGISTDDYMPKHEPLSKQKLNKTVRYFISNKGKWLYKCYEDGSQSHVEAPLNLGKMKKDWKVTYFNKSWKCNNFDDYGIDYSYYIHKARELVYQIENKSQLQLF